MSVDRVGVDGQVLLSSRGSGRLRGSLVKLTKAGDGEVEDGGEERIRGERV